MILQSTMAFFYKAAQVKKNWFWQYKVFSIIILQTAKIDPEWIFHPRPFRVFPMLLGVAAWCHTRSRGSIQKPGKVIENHNACLKNELVCWGFFSFKSSMVGSSLCFQVPKLFGGSLATFTSFLLNQKNWDHPRRGESSESPWLVVRAPRAPGMGGQLEGSPGLGRMCTLMGLSIAALLYPARGRSTADIPACPKAETAVVRRAQRAAGVAAELQLCCHIAMSLALT